MTSFEPGLAQAPILSDDQRMHNVPERLRVALDARAAERDMLYQQCLAQVRPEIERLTEQVVQRTVAQFLQAHPGRDSHL